MSQSRRHRMVRTCPEEDNENLESGNGDEFFEQPIDCQLLKKGFAYGVSYLIRTLDPDISCLLHCK
jgi:hypothetical protein